MFHRTLGHRRKERVAWILYNRPPAEALDRRETGRSVIEVAGKDDANSARTEDLRGRSKQRINGGTKSIFIGTFCRADVTGPMTTIWFDDARSPVDNSWRAYK
jgi:hypothetical protein